MACRIRGCKTPVAGRWSLTHVYLTRKGEIDWEKKTMSLCAKHYVAWSLNAERAEADERQLR